MSEMNVTRETQEENSREQKKIKKSIETKDKLNADLYSEKNIVSETQDKIQITPDRFKYIRTRIFKNGVIKKAIVGVEKIIQGKPRTLYNAGIDASKFKIAPLPPRRNQEI